jgi:hypothetical protein
VSLLGPLALIVVCAALIGLLLRKDLRRPRPALSFETRADRAAAFGCPAMLLGTALILAVFFALAFGW